jgi:hypothetical protein
MASRANRRDRVHKRRTVIAELLDAGLKQRDIAEHVGVSLSQVNRDVAWLRKQWREEQIEHIESVMVADLHRLETAISAIWPSVIGGSPGLTLQATDRLVKLIETRAKILGYSAPAKIDVTSGGDKVGPITVIEVVRPDED